MLASVSGRRFGAALVATALVATPLALPPVLFGTPAEAHGLPGSFSDLVAATKPAVVRVVVKGSGTTQPGARPDLPQFGPDNPFREFFERFGDGMPDARPGPRPDAPGHKAQGLGSGFIVEPDGVIVTNNHVIDDAGDITVVLDDGTELPATLVGRDAKTDLAVLRVEAGYELPTVAWGDSDALRVGDWVVAIGNPFGLGGTVTSGIVSARGRDINAGPYDDFIQIDAAINRGNSGGPLLDAHGGVVGINTAIFSPTGGSVGLGFAVPANQAKGVVAQILETGTVERGFIGVRIQPVTPDIADSLGLSKAEGALISDVSEDGPAAAAGLRQGDVILRFGDQPIDEVRDLTRAVAATEPGGERRLTVWRDGGGRDLSVTIGRMAQGPEIASAATGAAPYGTLELPMLGLTLADGSPAVARRFGLDAPVDGGPIDGAVVVAVEPGTPAADNGLRAGDVITAIGSTRIASATQMREAVERVVRDDRKSVLLLVGRQGGPRYIALPLREV